MVLEDLFTRTAGPARLEGMTTYGPLPARKRARKKCSTDVGSESLVGGKGTSSSAGARRRRGDM